MIYLVSSAAQAVQCRAENRSGDGSRGSEDVQCPVSSVQCPVSSVQCPVSSVRLVQTTEDTTLIYCVNLNMQIRSSGALIRALWIIMNVLQPGVMKVTHFLAMYFVCLVALSLR